MTKREVVKRAIDHNHPPYVPWHFVFSQEAAEKVRHLYQVDDVEDIAGNHLNRMGSVLGFFTDAGDQCVRDHFGVVWDRSIDKSFGYIHEPVLKKPSLNGFEPPYDVVPSFVEDFPEKMKRWPDRFRVFNVGLSLFERAWSLRGMENILTDFYDHPDFVHSLFAALADYNIALIEEALAWDIDAVYFLDDWGQQQGLLMGPSLWYEFIYPVLKRLYGFVHDAGKYVMIHSCGDVDELFDDLVEIGLDCFNPLQPEVMDAPALMYSFNGKLAFYGGISTQRLLPFGSSDEVRKATSDMITLGSDGGYICAPSQSIEADVPLENITALIETVFEQPGYRSLTLP